MSLAENWVTYSSAHEWPCADPDTTIHPDELSDLKTSRSGEALAVQRLLLAWLISKLLRSGVVRYQCDIDTKRKTRHGRSCPGGRFKIHGNGS